MITEDLTQVKNFQYSETQKIFADAKDFLPINGTDYVELYVGNASKLPIIIKQLLVSKT